MTVQRLISEAAPKPAIHDIRIEDIETLDAFAGLRSSWGALEHKDAESTVFLSWAWMNQAFHSAPGRWRVITAWVGQELVAVLPLKYRVHWSKTRSEFQTEIEAGGRLLWSEYTGFLCDPEFEQPALEAIAAHLQSNRWIRLSLRYVCGENRIQRFAWAFSQSQYRTKFKPYRINKGETDNLLCPQVRLPVSYDAYLAGQLSRNMRQKIRRFERKFLTSGDLRVQVATEASVEQDIDALLTLWRSKWSRVKGHETARRVAENYRQVLLAAQELGLLYLPVLKDGKRAIGALGHVLDPQQKRVHFIVAGRDERVKGNHIGALLHSQSLRWAIESGYRVYDFCHGNEPYKYGYGAKDVQAYYLSIRPRKLGRAGEHLDPLGHTQALARVLAFIEGGHAANAAAGTRQLIEQASESLRPSR